MLNGMLLIYKNMKNTVSFHLYVESKKQNK